MEGNQKNSISKLLMAVGVVFILIAGSIFVTTAWQYLPEWGKQLCLALGATGLFIGSYVSSKKEGLHMAETAFYYLGTAFIGFFSFSILGGKEHILYYVTDSDVQGEAFKIFTACMMMAVPILLRCLVKKSGVDAGILILLLDGVLINAGIALSLQAETFTLLLAGFVLVLAAVDHYHVANGREESGLGECVFVAYIIHGILYLLFPLMVFTVLSDALLPGFAAGLVFIAFLATGMTYRVREFVVFRVCNSVSLLWFMFVLIKEMNRLLMFTEHKMLVFFIGFFLNLVVMVCVNRKEIRYSMLIVGTVVPFVQILECSQMDSLADYLPFSFLLAAVFFILDWIAGDEAYGKLSVVQCVSGILQVVVAARYLSVGRMESGEVLMVCAMVFFLQLVQIFMTISVLVEEVTVKQFMYTFALGSGELAMFFLPLGFITFTYIHFAEWMCLMIGIGIILFGRIWDNDDDVIGILQFIATCLLLFVLLIHNLFLGELGCVLALGLVGVIMLLAAAIRNRKEYVIASSVTLIIMALYITREFWLNIEWWIYLFVAGVILIGLAIKKEKEM